MKTVLYALQLGDHGPTTRLPNRLSDLHDTYRVMIPTATEPVTPPPRERSVRRRRAHHPVLAPLQTPRGTPAVSSGQRLIAPANIRALDGTVHEDLRFVLPRTVGDLDRWGRLLSNCLADFGPSISAGRSFIVGVERDHQLTYAIEINARNAIRQFNGRANRPPTVRDRRTIIAALVEAGAITPPEYF